MVQSEWLPVIPEEGGPLWRRIVAALGADIRNGKTAAGERLPPHRDLAYRLGIGVGTIGKAYAEAERLGLVTSHVGRGTFIAGEPVSAAAPARRPDTIINMALNIPPIAPALAVLGDTLDALRQRPDLYALADYSPTPGLETVRRAGAEWLRGHGCTARATPERLIQTNGGQQALMLAVSSFAGPGETVLCDAATYPGNRVMARHGGWQLRGVASDARGMAPAALDRAVAESGARLVILIPTLHNPSGITLDAGRRAEIVEVARARDLTIVEDDIYRVFGRPEDPLPFAMIAPERTILTTSLSKALAPGLRLGFILPPEDDAVHARLLLAAQASGYCPPAAGGLIFAQWMADGTADRVLAGVRGEAALRQRMARDILGSAIAPPHSDHAMHVWLPMSADRAARVRARALQENVEVTPPEAPFVDPAMIDGLRVCLGAAHDAERCAQGLRVVKAALDEGAFIEVPGII
jgi:DNA-binding transcriptional MocR family regulator